MAPAEHRPDDRERLLDALREPLAAHARAGPDDAGRLACLLAARARFAAAVGDEPRGGLAALPPPFEGISVPSAAREVLAGVRDAADPELDPASLGTGYETALEGAGRSRQGQFFTPEPVAAGLVDWALDGGAAGPHPPRVLDPAAGSGAFLLAAFERLRTGSPDAGTAPILDGLVGVDIDAVALQLAGLRLAAAAGIAAPDGLSLHRGSFFDCVPPGARDAEEATRELAPVDAVVGNPPFVRAEDLQPGADHFRRHLAAFGPAGSAPLLDGPDALSRRSDAYVYFVTHATRFLRPGGRLALVLPTKWLTSDYGEGLRSFLRERYRVDAIVGFQGRAFGDALIDTALVFAERAEQAADGAPIRFVRLDRPAAPGDLRATAAGTDVPATAGVRERQQADLTAPGNLARYLDAPPELLSLFESAPFVRLDALATVARGTMTGANRFFFVDDDTIERFGIEARFLRPAVKSLRSIDRPTLAAGAVDARLVDAHSSVAAGRRGLDDRADPAAAAKAFLAAEGYPGLLEYVEHAEAEGWHRGTTCQSRAVWFDLGPLRAPACFVPKLLRERVFVVLNAADAIASNAIDGIWPDDGVDPRALVAGLCSSAGKAAMEVTGRDEAGLLQLMTYETASLPTLDVRACTPADRRTMVRAGEAYAEQPDRETLAALDDAVAEAFDLSLAPATLREHARALRRRRVEGGDAVATAGD